MSFTSRHKDSGVWNPLGARAQGPPHSTCRRHETSVLPSLAHPPRTPRIWCPDTHGDEGKMSTPVTPGLFPHRTDPGVSAVVTTRPWTRVRERRSRGLRIPDLGILPPQPQRPEPRSGRGGTRGWRSVTSEGGRVRSFPSTINGGTCSTRTVV